MNIRPTPLTAALAGILAALAWPVLWAHFGSQAAEGGIELVVGTLLVVALPAHAFVVGWQLAPQAPAGRLDTALLRRIGAWLAAAAAVTGLRLLAGI
ncbi:hypothetical protein [Aquabacterium sp. OR-4]|uniref:hypothetical protein n=1 Tax=Aquabacterium sp. OR-4 TaxID=2978127 RepID=UPI0021B23872|nr:hypothetical protein [Aquabacterium sp. OR-4]MDT7838549.1 hypothetical protein [Aquabacterium sp. OR-4]